MNPGSPVTLTAGSLQLEGRRHQPPQNPVGLCLVAHPHPQFGGDMDNNVVLAVCRAANARNLAAVRFNFRGVGASQGRSAGGEAEIEDLRGVLDDLHERSETRDLPFVLAGYSFGAWAAWRAAAQARGLSGLILVSPPMRLMAFDFSLNPRLLALFVVGDHDAFCSPNKLARALENAGRAETPRVVRGADHFWLGHETALEAIVGEFFVRGLSG